MGERFNQILRKFNGFMIDMMLSSKRGRRLFSSLAEPYIAGHSLEQALQNVDADSKKSRLSTIDILGEAATTIERSDEYMATYIELINLVSGYNENRPTISVKPTAICAVDKTHMHSLKETPLIDRLGQLAEHSTKRDVNLTLDMEDHNWTDVSLDAAQELWRSGYENLGIVLQSRLHRTANDIKERLKDAHYDLDKSDIRVRACIGIYDEPKDVAVTTKKAAKERLVSMVDDLFNTGVYVEIATHDHRALNRIIDEIIIRKGIPKERFEFQFLKGVHNAYSIEQRLMDSGYKVRYYMPFEINDGDGIPYLQRRLTANPGMVFSAMKNMMQRRFL
ncbi:hypothetical protein COV93_07410 [Candidatus Woesearchaeota archaeon CG11_big_fil_rev_8_21_14_0_20_43_8]|nr:MAG: hypothetical protein COV93_07410 [Candidatus Woesearchaeota archaeon CG11_big_fil_rev_8_21_14_0_20_43_8]PIO06812.1 MAG: hypothetical protein COT47_02610 [Candidatus Woesearchaeota archaeon CG08_land_8_20_14_0_20_43_7]